MLVFYASACTQDVSYWSIATGLSERKVRPSLLCLES